MWKYLVDRPSLELLIPYYLVSRFRAGIVTCQLTSGKKVGRKWRSNKKAFSYDGDHNEVCLVCRSAAWLLDQLAIAWFSSRTSPSSLWLLHSSFLPFSPHLCTEHLPAWTVCASSCPICACLSWQLQMQPKRCKVALYIVPLVWVELYLQWAICLIGVNRAVITACFFRLVFRFSSFTV